MRERISFNLLGPQGSGKGTQAKALLERFDFFHFDAGEALRQIRATDSPLGQKIASFTDDGQRVPPTVIAAVTYEVLSQAPTDKDILFDGLLRGLDELEAQRATFSRLKLDFPVIILLDINEVTALKRIAQRRICVGGGNREIINDEDDVRACLRGGGHLETRHDDTPEATKQRLSWYYRDTLPVINYFRQHGEVLTIDGLPAIEVVTKDVISKVEHYYQLKGLTPPTHHVATD